MARQSKSLSNAFERLGQNHEQQQVSVLSNSNTKTATVDVILNRNTETITNDVTLNSNTETITNDVTVNSNNSENNATIEAIKQDLLSMYEEKTNKEKVEDTHVRTTFLFRKDLAKRLDKLAKNKRGFKTMFMNKAIEALLEEMEKK